MYTLQEITAIRDTAIKYPNTGYCNVLSRVVYKIMTGSRKYKEAYVLREDCEDEGSVYHEYVIREINKELSEKGVTYIELANSSGEDRTVIHEFILFLTDVGVIRMESYGKEFTYVVEDEKAYKLPGYILHHGRLVNWPTWKDDIEKLLTMDHGKKRVDYWNKIFSSDEIGDTEEPIDCIMFK